LIPFLSFSALAVGQQTLSLALGATLLALLLRAMSESVRTELRTTWTFLVLGLMSLVAANVSMTLEHASTASFMAGLAMVLTVLALVQLFVLFAFQLLLPAIGFKYPRIAQDLSLATLSVAWGLYWLSQMGVEPGRLFTTSAIITGVVAFAMQDTLGNVLGGVALQLDNSLRIGDIVRVDDLQGTVRDIRWRYTAIETSDRETVVVPNSWLMKNRFRVLRPRPEEPLIWRRTLNFQIDAQANPARVIEVLNQAVADSRIEQVSQSNPVSTVLVDATAGYGRYALRYWLTDPTKDISTDSAVRMHVLAALTRAGIRLGAPQEQLHLVNDARQRNMGEKAELERRIAAVRGTPLFANLSSDEQDMLARLLVSAPFSKGGVLTRQGAVAHWLYLIVRGDVQVLVDEQGKVSQVSTLSDGDFFGEMGMLTGAPRSATVVAQSDVECYRLDKDGFAQVLRTRPDISNEISRVLEERQQSLKHVLTQARSASHDATDSDLLARIKTFFGLAG